MRSFVLSFGVLLACLLLVSSASADNRDRHRDKGRDSGKHDRDKGQHHDGGPHQNRDVRLLSASPEPVPLIFGETPTLLTGVVAIRLTESLKRQLVPDPPHPKCKYKGHRGCNHDRFLAEFDWDIRTCRGAPLSIVTTQVFIEPPYTIVSLPKDPTKPPTSTGVPTEPFLEVRPKVAFSGRDKNGRFIESGVHPYRVYSRVLQVEPEKKHSKSKVLDTSNSLFGTILTAPRPASPSVDPLPVTTNFPLLVLSGGKPPDTALLLNGAIRVALGPSTTWNTTKTLVEGGNALTLIDRNVFGIDSLPITRNVTLVTIPPEPPVVSVPPEFVATTTLTLSGTKAPGTEVLVNGVVVVPMDSSTTWSAQVTLKEGANNLLVQSRDAVGNLSLLAGSQTAQVAADKPVIGDLSVDPSEISSGQSVQIHYRLFAQVPPADNGPLKVTVNVQDGDLLVRTVFAGTEQGDPSGPRYTHAWDGKDGNGQQVPLNTSYRIVVSADRANPTTLAPDFANANPKESAVLVTGSQHFTSSDGKLTLIFRPDDAKMTIEQYPVFSAQQYHLLTARGFKPNGGSYRISVDRALSGPTVGVLSYSGPEGPFLRPFGWDEVQQDWIPVSRCNWNPVTKQLSFSLPSPGIFVFGATTDTTPPRLSGLSFNGTHFEVHALDDRTGINTTKIRLRQQGRELTTRMSVRLVNGVHDVLVKLDGYDAGQGPPQLYLEDWGGNGRLYTVQGQ